MAAVLGVATILLFRRVNALARLLSRQTANEQTQLSGLQIQFLQAFKYLASTGQQGDAGVSVLASISRLAEFQFRSALARSEESRVGKEWVSTCRSRCSTDHKIKKKMNK